MKKSLLAVMLLLAGIASAATTTVNLSGTGRFKAFDPNTGAFLVGGKLQSYVCGTSTPTSTYADSTGTAANANPTILDGSGEAPVWLDPAVCYKLVLKDPTDTVIWTLDNVNAPAAGVFTTITVTGTATFSSTTLSAAAFASTTANPATTGVLELAKSDCVKFRNNANSADISGLCLNGSDQVTAGSGPFAFPNSADTAVGKATVDIFSNKTLNTTNNAINLLNQQGPLAEINGTGADATMHTYTIPANTVAAGKGFRIHAGWKKTTAGAGAAVGYKITIGSTTVFGSLSTNSTSDIEVTLEVFNAAGSQSAQHYRTSPTFNGTAILSAGSTDSAALNENFANAVTIKDTFNVVAGDKVTPEWWEIELIQ